MVPHIAKDVLEERNKMYKAEVIFQKEQGVIINSGLANLTIEKLYGDGKKDLGYTKNEIRRALSKNWPEIETDGVLSKKSAVTYALNIIEAMTRADTDLVTGKTYYFKK